MQHASFFKSYEDYLEAIEKDCYYYSHSLSLMVKSSGYPKIGETFYVVNGDWYGQVKTGGIFINATKTFIADPKDWIKKYTKDMSEEERESWYIRYQEPLTEEEFDCTLETQEGIDDIPF
jgi:hypothetical protein